MNAPRLRRTRTHVNNLWPRWRYRFNRKNRFEMLQDKWANAALPAVRAAQPVPATLTIGGYVVGAESDPFLVGHPDIRYW